MSSTVACIGFTDPSSLAAIVREKGEPVHELSSTNRWVDASGAMLLLDRAAQYARPGFNTPVRTPYRGIEPLENGLAKVTLTDVSGFELEPFTVVPNNRYTVGWAPIGRVALVAMGIDTEFFANAEDFFDSSRSALPGFEGEPPAEVKQFGLPWPPTMEIETFLPSDKGEPHATLSGTVQFSEVQKNSETGHEFLVSRIATVSGEIDLCTPLPLDGIPQPGGVVVGQVELLAGFPPFGVEDVSTYVAPEEKVQPTFRSGESEVPEITPLDELQADLPEGLVLGDDGIVRTSDEHSAWKREGDSKVAPAPGGAGSQAPDAEDALDDRRELPAEEAVEQPDTAADDPRAASATSSPEPSAAPSPAPATPEDDSAPRPGETRREWRARTGR